MRVCAPGKLVLSGAYAVLEGAPAVVAAVDRYVVADTSRPGERRTPELDAALGDQPVPYFDASALRHDGRKLGLGSSAAIVVACLGALELEREPTLTAEQLSERVFGTALDAHRRAQGGGSGVDIAASCYGGVVTARRDRSTLVVRSVRLPPLVVEAWATGTPASTAELVSRVQSWAAHEPPRYEALMDRLSRSAEAAVAALKRGDSAGFIRALDDQRRDLAELGSRAKAEIVTPAVAELADLARQEGGTVLPSGAGGGDVSLFVGPRAAPKILVDRFEQLGHFILDLTLGAQGVHKIG